MTLLVGTAKSTPGPQRCNSRPGQQHLTSAQKFHHFRQLYLFVENNSSTNQTQQVNGRIKLLSGATEGTSYCPWSWAVDDDPHRIPRYLLKAECRSCNHYCRAVFYTHNALVQRCDRTTGEIIWKRKEKTMEITYLYDP